MKTGYGDFERNHDATADVAMGNINERSKKHRIAQSPTRTTPRPRLALDWVRDDLGDQDELDEFQHNLVTYCTSDYVPEKGDGFIAYAVMARRRAVEKTLETARKEKAAAASEWVGEIKQRIKGLTFTVTFTRGFDSAYGVRTLTKGYTAEGNGIIWWGAGGLDQGKTYRCAATVKAHEIDDYNGGGKVTQITNVRSVEEVDDVV